MRSPRKGCVVAGEIFISYSRTDDEYVNRLADYLIVSGLPVWYDYQIATGDRFDRVIASNIEHCGAFVVVMTPAAYESNWVASEVNHAKKHGKPILPLLLSGEVFMTLNYLDYRDVRGGHLPDDSFLDELANHLKAVQPAEAVARNPQEITAVQTLAPPVSRLELIHDLVGHESVFRVSWSPDGRQLATVADKTVRLWRPGAGGSVRTFEHAERVTCVKWSPDGRRIATCSKGDVWFWDPDTGKLERRLKKHRYWFEALAWSPDGHRLAAGGTYYKPSPNENRVVVWNLRNGVLPWHFGYGGPVMTLGTARSYGDLAWSPDGTRIAASGSGEFWAGTSVWAADTRRIVQRFDDGAESLTWSEDGQFLATADRQTAFLVWRLGDDDRPATLSSDRFQDVSSVAWSPVGQFLAVTGKDSTAWASRDASVGTGVLVLFDVLGGWRECAYIRDPGYEVGWATWSPDGHYIATCGGLAAFGRGHARVWKAPVRP
jgi:WD40 repeat protein